MTQAMPAILARAMPGERLPPPTASLARSESVDAFAGIVALAALDPGAVLGDNAAGATAAIREALLAFVRALDDRGAAPRRSSAARGAADDASLRGVESTVPDAALVFCAVWDMVESAATETPMLQFRVFERPPLRAEPRPRRRGPPRRARYGAAGVARRESACREQRRKAPRLAPRPVPSSSSTRPCPRAASTLSPAAARGATPSSRRNGARLPARRPRSSSSQRARGSPRSDGPVRTPPGDAHP